MNTWWRDLAWSLILVGTLLSVRLGMPSDLWKRSQPYTLRATTDILVEGHWVVPHTVDDLPLAKPPLINWLSVPFVSALDFHPWSFRLVPAFASVVTFLFTMRLVRQYGGGDNSALAAAMLMGATWLGWKGLFLVRPDPVLLSALTVGFFGVQRRLEGDRLWGGVAVGLAVAIGLLTKSVAVAPLVVLAIFAPRFVRQPRHLWAPLPVRILAFSLLPFMSWVLAAELAEPGFPLRVLFGDEIFGRVTGTGAEAAGRKPMDIVLGVWKLPLHFFVRTLPLSLFGLLALRRLAPNDPARLLVWFVVLHLLVFGFSASRRADWMLPALPALAVLVGARLLPCWRRPVAHCGLISGVALAAMAGNEYWQAPRWANAIDQFAGVTKREIAQFPAPVLILGNDRNHLVGVLGVGGPDRAIPIDLESLEIWLEQHVAPGGKFWVVTGDRAVFGMPAPVLPADGLDQWPQLDGKIDWKLEVDHGESQYMWPGALRLGLAQRRQ